MIFPTPPICYFWPQPISLPKRSSVLQIQPHLISALCINTYQLIRRSRIWISCMTPIVRATVCSNKHLSITLLLVEQTIILSLQECTLTASLLPNIDSQTSYRPDKYISWPNLEKYIKVAKFPFISFILQCYIQSSTLPSVQNLFVVSLSNSI